MSSGNGGVAGRNTEILCIDDSAADAELLRSALTEYPALTVRTVVDGHAALSYLRVAGSAPGVPRPDLILLDLHLPTIDGRRVLAEIKADPALRVIPVIILSSSDRHEDLRRAYELGANACVTKPARLTRYRDVVRAIYDFWCCAAAPAMGEWSGAP